MNRIKIILILIIIFRLYFKGVVRHRCTKVDDIHNDSNGMVHKSKRSLEENLISLLFLWHIVCDIKKETMKYSNLHIITITVVITEIYVFIKVKACIRKNS